MAITDEGTSLQQEALDQGFRAVFVNPSDIGGRYSALSFFGMVPAALIGVDLERLLDGVRAAAVECGPDVPAGENPALRLGAVLGEAALAGRDKLTIVAEPPAARRSAPGSSSSSPRAPARRAAASCRWTSSRWATRRCTATTACSPTIGLAEVAATGLARQLMDLAEAGHPVIGRELDGEYELGGEFLRWEIAVATAGRVLGIDPFDQPNVQESKDNTRRLLAGYIASGELLEDLPEGEGRLAYPVHDDELPAALAAFLAQAQPGDYVALQAYVAPGEAVWDHLQALRLQLRDRPAPGDHAGLRPALSALHRPAAQGRSEQRPVPAAGRARPAGRGHPRPALQLQRAQAGAGAR